ncbi:MarR family winged helix-turn-helix transcriptional regulator [Pseudooceanicola marinus]|uniref:MarR family winged helix-turn-helix transcriptional regulator n=1 Tax=Pseudooceanicola marinus TaxID=396013 RepID=UPI001CD32F59|nr:MarR family transcriptional regulator [Pseudooceanicola marinus]MCA1336325.1 MarR family transcriptional regulator [Pseudooceanicola marinus]
MEITGMAGHLIRRLNQHSTHVFQQRTKAAGLDLTPVQFAAMGAVRDNPGIDQAGVAGLIAYDRATIGGVIERLVQKGHLRREVSATDRRARAVYLTEGGAALLAQALPVVAELQAEILTGLTAEESAQFHALAGKVLARLDAPDAAPAPASQGGDAG